MTQQLLFLEFNEINFDYVQFYCHRGLLPHFDRMIRQHGLVRTHSEGAYEHLEPWIQWVTAHTGLSLSEHGVFRLGDIVKHDLVQIWERLESLGLRVGAICPMNAKNQLHEAAFFLPDPWTATEISAPKTLTKFHRAISEAVNDNAKAKVAANARVHLLRGTIAYARLTNYASYARLATRSRRHPWRRALLLDLLLSDIFVRETIRTAPDFATLFLNAAAHVQHHYMRSSTAYDGVERNPEWYANDRVDPVLEGFRLYDRILGQVRECFPTARIMIATALHQVPHEGQTYYWRLTRHADFLRLIGVSFVRVEPRMSRDFLVVCSSPETASDAAHRLKSAVADDGLPLFDVDNRGTDLFVMLVYPRFVTAELGFSVEGDTFKGLRDYVVFVAIKNGKHDGTGYFIDSGLTAGDAPRDFPLTELPARVLRCFGFPAERSNERASGVVRGVQ